MPQASDYVTLYQIEGALESALSSVLTTASVTHHLSRGTGTKTAPFADVQVTLGAASEHMTQDNDGTWRDDFFSFTATFRVVTNRLDDATTHKSYRAKIRNALATYAGALNTALTYHQVADLTHQQSTAEIVQDDDLDVSAMEYSGKVKILEDSWPAATP